MADTDPSIQELTPELQMAKLTVLERLNSIEARLKEQDPMLPLHIENIKSALSEHEELIHILPDERIRILVSGLMKYKALKIVEEEQAKKRKKAPTADDL